MQHALDLAAAGEGLTRPNPPVGAVVVKHNRLIGEGFHPRAGMPHAEVFSLREAGDEAKDATLYITLEPCCTQGRTPPCTEAIIKAGIKRVVYGCVDPNPAHAGRADAILKKAGIDVVSGVLEESCQTMIRPFATRLLQHRPFVTLKLACSLDGRIADAKGQSKWITGTAARNAVQELRRAADAILVGAETVRTDNPSLLPRPALGRKPWRVVVAGSRPLPRKAKVFTDAYADHTMIFSKDGGNVSLKAMMKDLAAIGCMHVVCEGGGGLAHSLLKAGLVDQLWMFYAPKIMGGDGRPAVAGKGWRLDHAPGFVVNHVERLGEDVLVVLNNAASRPHYKRRS
jgi:diaminohydroxyphosphoribosylaminopyrimidine deaminase/5-amino-6-(5-phosphoribosylamino)uracil reductase